MFGCWADLAKDSVHIRYIILSGLHSAHVLEVKASLFAAGCICILSEDFACVVLEVLVGIVSSLEISADVKLEAIRVFSKMRCSFSSTSKAYKVGKTLLPCLQQGELIAEMLSSLSKLSIKSSLIISQQVDLLLSFVSHESASLVRARTLKCLYFLFDRGACCFAIERNILSLWLKFFDGKELSPNFRYGWLRILQKIICNILPDITCIDMSDIFSLVLVLKIATQSSAKAERCLAVHLLVDVCCSLKKVITENWSASHGKWNDMPFNVKKSFDDDCHSDGPSLLVSDVVLLIGDQMNSLVKQMILESGIALAEMKKEFKSLLCLINHLVFEYPSIAHSVLSKIKSLIQALVSVDGTFNMENAGTGTDVSQMEISSEEHEYVLRPHKSNDNQENSVVSELMPCICRFTVACLDILHETGALNSEVYHLTRSLIECIDQSGFYGCETYEMFSLRIRYDVFFNCYRRIENSMQVSEVSKVVNESSLYHNLYWAVLEWRVLEFTRRMLKERNYWAAYRSGIYACSEGAWFAAAFIFRKLIDVVRSDSCRCFVRSLILLAGSESEIKLLLFPEVGFEMISTLQSGNDCGKTFSSIEGEMYEYTSEGGDLRGCEGRFAKIYSRIRSCEENLASSGTADGAYYFQRWFLSLRAKVIEIIVETLGLLYSHSFTEEELHKSFEGDTNIPLATFLQTIPSVISGFAGLSFRLNNVAREYDLLSASFLDIDSKSFRCISRQAFGSSVLAFSCSFALYFFKSPLCRKTFSNSLGNMIEITQITALRDLVERLGSLDEEVTIELKQLMTVYHEVMNAFQAGKGRSGYVFTDGASLLFYKCLIEGVLSLQEDSKEVEDEKDLPELLLKGLRLLAGIVKRWIEIPFSVPKYFFRVRPNIGAELFIFNTAPGFTPGLSITKGSQLSLNLGIQVKNASRKPHLQFAKIYCILAIRQSDHFKDEKQARRRNQACEMDEMVNLYYMLLQLIKTDISNDLQTHVGVHDGGLVTTSVCFEPSRRGQGFSTCLLDVSGLSEGSYPIKWHSCCIDKKGRLWSLLPLNHGSVLTVKEL